MKIVLRTIFLFFVFAFLTNCEEDEITERPYPRLMTLPVTNITSNGAVFNAELVSGEDKEIVEYGFVWGMEENPRIGDAESFSLDEALTPPSFSLEVTSNLETNSVYYVRAFVRTPDFLVYGRNQEFLSRGSSIP